MAGATIGNLTGLIFANAMGVQAAILWMCAGYASALFEAERRSRDDTTRTESNYAQALHPPIVARATSNVRAA